MTDGVEQLTAYSVHDCERHRHSVAHRIDMDAERALAERRRDDLGHLRGHTQTVKAPFTVSIPSNAPVQGRVGQAGAHALRVRAGRAG